MTPEMPGSPVSFSPLLLMSAKTVATQFVVSELAEVVARGDSDSCRAPLPVIVLLPTVADTVPPGSVP